MLIVLNLIILVRFLLEHAQAVATIELLGNYLLKLGNISREYLASDFIRRGLEELKQILPYDSAWWGLIIHDSKKQQLGLHQAETIGLPLKFATEWKGLAFDDEFAQSVHALSGVVHNYSYLDDYQDLSEGFELNQFSRKYQLLHGMSICIKDPFTGHIFFITLYRNSGFGFSDIDKSIFSQTVRHIIQLWRHNLQDALAISLRNNMFHAGFIREDGYVLTIGMHLCEVIYKEWPEWDGLFMPTELLSLIHQNQQQILIGKQYINISKKAGNFYIELNNIKKILTLSPREYHVSCLFAEGYSYKQIAEQVELSPSTVRTYLQRAYSQLGVNNKIQLSRALKNT